MKHEPAQSRTTPPTDAELDELLGKPGPPIEVDAEQLAAAVALQRAEAQSRTTLPTWAYISWKPRAGYARCTDPACRYQHKEHYHESSAREKQIEARGGLQEGMDDCYGH